MNLIRCATLRVADVAATAERYASWLDYEVIERGQVEPALASAWGAPATADRSYVVLRPASGKPQYLRFVAGPAEPDYRPLRSFGWNAIELCVTDVEAVAARMAESPFTIIGPPKTLEGLTAIKPMQVRGPDEEIVYFTEIRDHLPDFTLPRAESLIDSLFILVMGCSALQSARDWVAQQLGFDVGREWMELVYTMINDAYELPADRQHAIATLTHDRDVFLELDQYPPQAVHRPGAADDLPAGISLGTFLAPHFDDIDARLQDRWIAAPAAFDSIVYDGRRAATVSGPDGTRFELIESF